MKNEAATLEASLVSYIRFGTSQSKVYLAFILKTR